MKKVLTFLTVICMINAYAQTIITHRTNSSNTGAHITTVNNPVINGKSDIVLIVSQKGTVKNDNEIGVWYSGGKWKIFNQNRKQLPLNATFNVLALPKNYKKAFTHVATGSNTRGHITTLNSSFTNNKPDELLFITQKFGKYNTSNVGVWYNGGKWKIYNENRKPIPIGTNFNVFVANERTNNVGGLNLYAFGWRNRTPVRINHIRTSFPLPKTAGLFVTQNFKSTYNSNNIGIKYDTNKWGIVNQNSSPLPKNLQFNVLVTKQDRQVAANRPKIYKKSVVLPGFRKRTNISYTVKDNLAIYEGDIVLGSSRNVVDPKPDPLPKKRDFSSYSNGAVRSTSQPLVQRISDGLIDRDWLWPHGIIPYRIRSGFTSAERRNILEAIEEINRRTNLNIIPNNGQYHFIYFLKDTGIGGAGRSRVGRVRIPQAIRLNSNAGKNTVIHEILHAAGFWHEQSRSDRDQYIKINWENIADGLDHNFDKHTTDGYKVTPYDPHSIMHYSGLAFSKDNVSPTIVDSRTNSPVRGGSGLTDMDIDGINTVYERDYVSYVTRPINTLRYIKTTILRVQSDDRDGGRKTAIDFYMKNETGPGWDWRPGGGSNPTEKHKSGVVEESDNDIRPNWQFRYAIPRNEEFAKVWLHLRDDDGRSGTEGGISPDEDVDINYFPNTKAVELFVRTTDGRIYLGNMDGVREDRNYIGQVGEELEVQGFEGQIKAKVTFKIEIE